MAGRTNPLSMHDMRAFSICQVCYEPYVTGFPCQGCAQARAGDAGVAPPAARRRATVADLEGWAPIAPRRRRLAALLTPRAVMIGFAAFGLIVATYLSA